MENINVITNEVLDEILEDDNNKKYTKTELMTLDSMKKVNNPFTMLTVKDVMRDLKISESAVYKTFNRKDFPAIKVGKKHQVMLLPYLIWKMDRKD